MPAAKGNGRIILEPGITTAQCCPSIEKSLKTIPLMDIVILLVLYMLILCFLQFLSFLFTVHVPSLHHHKVKLPETLPSYSFFIATDPAMWLFDEGLLEKDIFIFHLILGPLHCHYSLSSLSSPWTQNQMLTLSGKQGLFQIIVCRGFSLW